MRLLVLATDPIGPDDVRSALGGEDVENSDVLVVSPAVNESPLAFWVSDSDEAITDAESVAARSVAALSAKGAGAKGQTGESEPLVALQDALAQFPADRIVLFLREGDASRYREDDIAGEAERRFGVPVTEVLHAPGETGS